MNREVLNILMLEDNELDAELNQEQLNLLEEYNCITKVIKDKEEYINEITSSSLPDLILCDYNLPMFNGMEALKELNSRDLIIPFIFVTGTMQEEIAADAIKAGAWDYVVKDRLFRLPLAIRSVLKLKKEKVVAIKADEKTQRLIRGIDKTSMLVIVVNKDYIIDYVNHNFTKVSGFKYDDVFGKSLFSVFSYTKQELRDNMLTILQKKEPYIGDIQIRNDDETFFWIRLSITPIFDEKNDLNSYTIIADDISEQKKLEEDLKKSFIELQTLNKELEIAKNKAEENDNLKSAFLANLSHEIRTPMNGILGFTELIKSGKLSSDKIIQFIEIIHQSGNRLINIIDDLVKISQIEANQVTINSTNINLNELVDGIYDFFKPQADQKGLLFTCEKELNDTVNFYIDRLKLEQILSNLLNNAFKFTSKGTIHLKYFVSNENIFFSVKDSGIGISPGKKNAIFERFLQADHSYLKSADGMGLGLSISKSFVEKMGGEIWVESEIGKGSEFIFRLPFITHNEEVKELSKTKHLFDKEINILIAEDEEVNYLYLREILNNENIKILHADNGEKAIQLFYEHSEINLILMDLKLPIINGIDAIYEIRKKNSKIPIIALTAYVSEKDKQAAMNAGCNDFITKPVKKNLLLERIILALKSV